VEIARPVAEGGTGLPTIHAWLEGLHAERVSRLLQPESVTQFWASFVVQWGGDRCIATVGGDRDDRASTNEKSFGLDAISCQISCREQHADSDIDASTMERECDSRRT